MDYLTNLFKPQKPAQSSFPSISSLGIGSSSNSNTLTLPGTPKPANPANSLNIPKQTAPVSQDVKTSQNQTSFGNASPVAKPISNVTPNTSQTSYMNSYTNPVPQNKQQISQFPTNTPGNPNYLGDNTQNLNRVYQANAPLDKAQFQPQLDLINQSNQQYANAKTASENSDMNLRKEVSGNAVPRDYFQNSLQERNRIYDYNLLGAGNQQQAANQTLTTQLALANALRGQGQEQAMVPYNTVQNSPIGKQSLDTLFNLQQQYPDAGINYNPALSPQDNLMQAQALAAKTPRYQAQSTSISYQTLPNGQTVAINTKSPSSINGSGNVISTPQQNANFTANKSSLDQLTQKKNNLQTSYNALTQNGNLLLNTMAQLGVNDNNSPILNTIFNKIQSRAFNGNLAQFQNSLNTVRNEYANYLARGNATTEGDQSEAAKAIPDNISVGDLKAVIEKIQTEGQNIIGSYDNQINQVNGQLNGGGSSQGSIQAGGYNFTQNAQGQWVPLN